MTVTVHAGTLTYDIQINNDPLATVACRSEEESTGKFVTNNQVRLLVYLKTGLQNEI